MRRAGLITACLLTAVGCARGQAASTKPATYPPPNTRLVFHGGTPAGGVYTFCDRGNRIYFTDNGLFQVVAGSCPDGQP